MARIIHGRELDFKHRGGDAERQMLEALKALPEDYYVLRECEISTSSEQKVRPDFIVVGPDLGILVLKVKNWDIHNNKYENFGEYKLTVNQLDGTKIQVKHPWRQAEKYEYALRDLLSKRRPWTEHAVVFPKLTCAEFINKFDNRHADNPQSGLMIDLKHTLFRDDIIALPSGLLAKLREYVTTQSAANHSELHYTKQEVVIIVGFLLPEMRVGGLPDYTEVEEQLKLLDEEQQKWAFSPQFVDKKYLIDVAGSGKTNVLLSRAIYRAKQHYDNGGCRILVITYNTALKNELGRIFAHKIAQDPLEAYYRGSIYITDIVSIMEAILQKEQADDFQRWQAEIKAHFSEQRYIEEILPSKCRDILATRPHDFAIYDYLLIDEVQDFSTRFLHIALGLLNNKQNLFVVGDIGQKLFDRTVEWWSFDIGPERVSLPSRFLMYRSPQPVAKLAWQFLISDASILLDLQEEKYNTRIKPKSPVQSLPNFIPSTNENSLLQCLAEDIKNYAQMVPLQKILCIGLQGAMLTRLHQKLTEIGILNCWAKEAKGNSDNQILLADYIDTKGLERDYVFIVDADQLATRQNPFDTDDHYRQSIRKDRIKLFIALTRAMHEVRLYYVNYQHPFIKEMRKLEAEINR